MADCQTYQKLKRIYIKIAAYLLAVLTLAAACSKEPEGLKNSQAYYDAITSLEQDIPVIVILLDGLGYMQFSAAAQAGSIPYISSLADAQKAETYYPSISPVGLAAMVTGVGPGDNGITSREDKDLAVKDIFQRANEMNKAAVLVEGDIKLINTSVEPYLNPDLNNDGFTDDEVFEAARTVIQYDKFDLIFVHFHGIDDVAHIYGPMSDEAMARTLLIDGYVQDLLEGWKGAVIISSDHGQHENGDGGGEHGTDMDEDMFVPYLFIERLQ